WLARACGVEDRGRGTGGSAGPGVVGGQVDERVRVSEDISRVPFYATAREHTEAMDPETNDLATLARDRAADLESILLFVELEWLALDDAAAGSLLEADELEPYRHRLRVAREEKPYAPPRRAGHALNPRRPPITARAAP